MNWGNDGSIRHTSEMTITMDHTDNMDHDGDASDLTVYFDEDYLNTKTTKSGSTLTLKISNVLNMENDVNPVEGFKTVNFTVGEIPVAVDVSAVASYADVRDAINAKLAELELDTVTASLGTPENAGWSQTTTIDGTTYNFGDVAGQLTPVIITNTGAEELVKGEVEVAEGGDEGDINKSWDDTESQESTLPISINVELEKVGDDGDGGNLIIGGKDQNSINLDVDKNDGIDIFNVTVLGGEDKPSNLGMITSTNDFLKTVNVKSDNMDEEGYAALTVRGIEGEKDDSAPFGGTLTTFNANDFKGDLYIGQVADALNIDTFTATGGGDVTLEETINADGNFMVTTGTGSDKLTIDLDGDAVDTIGESFKLNAGNGDNTVTVSMGTTDATDAGVSIATTAELDNLSITTGSGADKVTLIGGTDEADTADGDADFDITTGAASDFVYINSINDVDTNGAAKGSWSVGDATVAGTDFTDQVLYKATLTVSFAGFESTIKIDTNSSDNFIATQVEINDAIIAAIEANPELDELLTTTLGTGSQELTIASIVEGLNDLSITVNQPTVVATLDADVSVAAGQVKLASTSDETALLKGLLELGTGGITSNSDDTDIMTAVNGAIVDIISDTTEDNGSSVNETSVTNISVIDLGKGDNDLVVLNSDDDSANTLVFSDLDMGKVSVVNYFTDIDNTNGEYAEEGTLGAHQLDFTAFLTNTEDNSVNTPANSLSEARITTKFVQSEGAEVDANSVNMFTFAQDLKTTTTTTDDQTWDNLDASKKWGQALFLAFSLFLLNACHTLTSPTSHYLTLSSTFTYQNHF